MELNKRCLDIMAYLRQEQDYVTVEALSEKYGVSARGIRYNLDKIEQYMAAHNMPYLERERIQGVRLAPTEEVYRFVDSCAGRLVSFQYSYSADERQLFLRAALLVEAEPVTLETLCRRVERSRNTLFKDLELTEQWLDEREMKLVKRPRVGMYVTGGEANRRELVTELIMENVENDDLLRYMRGKEIRSKMAALLMETLLPRRKIRMVKQALNRIEALLSKQFSDETFSTLVIHLSLLLCRAGAAELRLGVPDESYIPLCDEYGAAKVVLDELEHQAGIHVPEAEVYYFTYNLLGAKVMRPELTDLPGEGDELYAITVSMTREIEQIYRVDFGAQREEIVQGILLHLKPAVHRIRYGLYNKNLMYNEIVTNYNALFINTRIVIQHLERYVGKPINDHEVAYIALHFGAALHRVNKRTSTRDRVLLVCGTGLGSAKMITSQIDKLFNVEVVDTVSGRVATEMDKRGIDYIITTVPIPEEAGYQYIRVSPMFTEKDQQTVGQYLTVRYTPKERYDKEVFTANRLIAIVERHCTVTDRLHLQYELLNELMNNNPLDLGRRRDEYRLCDLLPLDRVTLGVPCTNWRDSIAVSARVLEQQGLILPNYKEAVIRNMEEFGPYMVMLPGMVLSHAGPEEGVLGLGMSLTVLATPINFGYPDHDPVRVVVTLAAEDDKKHLKALAQLFRMLKDGESSRVIFHGSKDEIMEEIKHYSY